MKLLYCFYGISMHILRYFKVRIYLLLIKYVILIYGFILQIYGLKDKIAAFVCSGDLEVQERSSSALVLLECLKENPGLAQELMEAFEGELNPVAPKAQRKVGID